MNWLTIPRWIGWVAALAILVVAGTLWVWSRLVWTPVQRYYVRTYLRCSWPGFDPVSPVEVRWIYKTAANGKPELAGEDDAISATDADSRIGMELSPAARQAGWTGLMQGPEERVQIVGLKPRLEEQFFDGQNFWIMVLLPLLCGFLLLCFLLAGLSWLQDWIEVAPWRAKRFPWEEPAPTLFQKWMARAAKVRSLLSDVAVRWTRMSAPKPSATAPAVAPAESPKTPLQAAFSPFGATHPLRKPGFVWTEKDEIE